MTDNLQHKRPKAAKDPNKPKAPRKISEKYLRNAGLHYLKRFTASSSHFKTVMMRKIDKSCRWHTDTDKQQCVKWLDIVTDEFIEAGYLNDEQYTFGLVNSMRRSGKSKRIIQMKLRQKGVSDNLVISAFEKYEDQYDDNANFELICALKHAKKKKLGAFSKNKISKMADTICTDNEAAFKDQQKQLANLARAGFSFDISKKALDMNEDDALDLIGSLD